MKKVLLYSGGLDSWLISKLWQPDVCLYVNTGTDYGREELKRLPSNVIIVEFPLAQFEWKDNTRTIPMRNMFLSMIGAMYGNLICLGSLVGDNAVDKTPEFMSKANVIFEHLWQPYKTYEGKKVELVMPFKSYTKTDLLKTYLQQGGRIEDAFNESFSCFSPIKTSKEKSCYNCQPCIRKAIAFLNCGWQYDFKHKLKIKTFIETNFLPKMNNSVWHGKEDLDIRRALKLCEK
jgi:7-cyano-7-deazaguanine synthase in queuosine biosynthesis